MNDYPLGTGRAVPYGNTPAPTVGPVMPNAPMGGVDSAQSNIGYRPMAGRADRLAANIVGSQTFKIPEGGYSGGATSTI